jgi:hypothetical protein
MRVLAAAAALTGLCCANGPPKGADAKEITQRDAQVSDFCGGDPHCVLQKGRLLVSKNCLAFQIDILDVRPPTVPDHGDLTGTIHVVNSLQGHCPCEGTKELVRTPFRRGDPDVPSVEYELAGVDAKFTARDNGTYIIESLQIPPQKSFYSIGGLRARDLIFLWPLVLEHDESVCDYLSAKRRVDDSNDVGGRPL